jgi:hypothetical protein
VTHSSTLQDTRFNTCLDYAPLQQRRTQSERYLFSSSRVCHATASVLGKRIPSLRKTRIQARRLYDALQLHHLACPGGTAINADLTLCHSRGGNFNNHIYQNDYCLDAVGSRHELFWDHCHVHGFQHRVRVYPRCNDHRWLDTIRRAHCSGLDIRRRGHVVGGQRFQRCGA